MLEVIFGLFFGLLCMVLGCYLGFTVSENKNLKDILSQYEDEDLRNDLERNYESS